MLKGTVEEFGFLVPQSLRRLEKPRDLSSSTKEDNDEVFIYGGNQAGDIFMARINRKSDSTAEVMVYLKFCNGQSYTLPLNKTYYTTKNDCFSAGGLTLQCLSPIRRWRIFFNGLLKTPGSDGKKECYVYVKFSLIGAVTGPVHDFQSNIDVEAVAESLQKASSLKDPWTKFKRLEQMLNQYDVLVNYFGTVAIDSNMEEEIYLWGFRNRNLGKEVSDPRYVSAKFYGCMEDGMNFHVEVIHMPNAINRLCYGYMFLPNSNKVLISVCDFCLPWTSSDTLLPKQLQFFAGEKNYVAKLQASKNHEICTIRKWSSESFIYHIELVIDGFKGHGIAVFNFGRNEISVPKRTVPLLVSKEFKNIYKNMPSVVTFDDPLCQDLNITGGKGGSLALLCELCQSVKSMKVPSGMVITNGVFHHHINENPKLRKAISNLEAHRDAQLTELSKICSSVEEEFEKCDISASLKITIIKKLKELFPKDLSEKRFAVRSSAIGEDNVEMSAAGQLTTLLGVDVNNIAKAVAKCWGSQFSLTAIQYKRQNGQILSPGMGVVIQEMVPSDVSGVAFSCDPVTGNPAYISISASYGLGEAVVSATVDPDTIVVLRNGDELSIHSKHVGEKRICIKMADEDGTVEEKVVDENAKVCSLSDEKALLLGYVVTLVEEAYCDPRDIEWAFVKGQLYLLQARPVTTVNYETEFEIIHELDTGLKTEFEYTTKANVGEVIPEACSPLGICIMKFLEIPFNVNRCMMKGKSVFNPFEVMLIHSSHNHMLLDVLNLLFENIDPMESWSSRIFEIAICGRLLEDKIYRQAIHRFGYSSSETTKSLLYQVVSDLFSFNWKIKLLRKKIFSSYMKLPSTSSQTVYNEITKRIPELMEVALLHLWTSQRASSQFSSFVISVLVKSYKEYSPALFSDLSKLLTNAGNVESLDVPGAMRSLASVIAASEIREKFISLSPKEALKCLQGNKGKPGKSFCQFIEAHGHRAVMEFDIYTKEWKSNQENLIPSLQMMVKNSQNFQTSNNKSLSDLLNELQTPLSLKSKIALHFLVRLARLGVRMREQTKSLFIKKIDVYRQAFNHLADVAYKEGFLPDRELLFFLTLDELEELLANRSAHVVNKSKRRMKIHNKLKNLRFPEMMSGIRRPISKDTSRQKYSLVSSLKGMAVSPGNVTGKARVVMNFGEASSIEPGEILVTYSTDVAWSIYFPLISGLVTEIGGLISHGAVVAREYGIPCVVDVLDATSLIETGSLIEINGNEGMVKIIECKNDEEKNGTTVTLSNGMSNGVEIKPIFSNFSSM